MRIVLDTNTLLISIPGKSDYRFIFYSLLSEKFSLLVCDEILFEYEEIISEKANQTVAINIVEMLLTLKNVEKMEIYFKWNLIRADGDDNKFVDCAIAGNADFIVTNDKHFKELKKIDFPKVHVITIQKFLQILQQNKFIE